MVSPNVDAARAAAESLMVDEIVIKVDPKGTTNAAMDPDTLKITQPPGEPADVYDVTTTGNGGRELLGKARILPGAAQPHADRVGGTSYIERPYRVSIPWDAPEIPVGAVVEVVAAQHDPDLAGKTLTVRSAPVHSFVVTRQLVAELRS